MGIIRYSLLILLLWAGSVIVMPPSAALSATVDLDYNNIGLSGSVGTVTLTQNGADDVLVTIVMNDGFSLKIGDGNDVGFNSAIMPVSVAIQSATIGTTPYTTGISTTLATDKNIDGLGVYDVALTHITCADCPSGTNSFDQITFDISATGLMVSDLLDNNANGFAWTVHFCTDSGGLCGTGTGFAAGEASPVPLPAAALLFGSGLFGLAGWRRLTV